MREPRGVPGPCGHSCTACATVCLTVVSSFSDITGLSTISDSFKTDRSRTPLFHVAQYGDDITGRELNLRKLPGRQWESNPQPSEQRRPMTIKTSASTETANAPYMYIYIYIYMHTYTYIYIYIYKKTKICEFVNICNCQ